MQPAQPHQDRLFEQSGGGDPGVDQQPDPGAHVLQQHRGPRGLVEQCGGGRTGTRPSLLGQVVDRGAGNPLQVVAGSAVRQRRIPAQPLRLGERGRNRVEPDLEAVHEARPADHRVASSQAQLSQGTVAGLGVRLPPARQVSEVETEEVEPVPEKLVAQDRAPLEIHGAGFHPQDAEQGLVGVLSRPTRGVCAAPGDQAGWTFRIRERTVPSTAAAAGCRQRLREVTGSTP